MGNTVGALQPRRGKRAKAAAASLGVDMDGVCITYTRSQPPSSARVLDSSDNVLIGAFPVHTDRWLAAADNEHNANDLFEKVNAVLCKRFTLPGQ